MWIQWPFFKKFNQRSMTLRWPLTPLLFRSHVWHYPRIIVSKSHENTSMNADTVINFAKHTTYYVQITDYIQNEWSHSLFLNKGSGETKMDNSETMCREILPFGWKFIFSLTLPYNCGLALRIWSAVGFRGNFKTQPLVGWRFRAVEPFIIV